MRSLALALVWLLGLSWAGTAPAASLFFQGVPTAGSTTCPNPCHQLQMFIEDPTRDLDFTNIQIGLSVIGASMSVVATPPASNANAVGGNSLRLNDDGDALVGFPWNLASTTGRPTYTGAPDILVVNAAAGFFDVNSLQELTSSYASFCSPAAICAIQDAALAADRIFIGRFNISRPGPEVFVRIEQVEGSAPGIDDPTEGIRRLNGSIFPVSMVPEPAGAVALGIALALVVLRRAGSRVVGIALLVVLALAGRTASAAPITWQLQGFVNTVGTVLFDHGVRLGNPVVGSLTFDPELAVQRQCDEFSDCHYDLPASMVLSIRDHQLQADVPATLSIDRSRTLFRFDSESLLYDGQATPTLSFAMLLLYAPPTVAPDGLPANDLPVPEIDQNLDTLEVLFREDPIGPGAGFTATLVSVSRVPEPGGFALSVIAILTLARLRWSQAAGVGMR